MRILLITLLLTLSLFLNGCFKVFAIFVSQTPDGVVTLRLEPDEKARNKGAYIRYLDISRDMIPNQNSQMV
jgi:hypothetical protein